jgi:hypothetical protein
VSVNGSRLTRLEGRADESGWLDLLAACSEAIALVPPQYRARELADLRQRWRDWRLQLPSLDGFEGQLDKAGEVLAYASSASASATARPSARASLLAAETTRALPTTGAIPMSTPSTFSIGTPIAFAAPTLRR